jgi:hypothetical protein
VIGLRHADEPPAPESVAEGLPGEERSGASRKILVVEDNPVNQIVAARLLERRGHQVAAAANGREVVAAVEREGFDLVLMDVHMPEMDGYLPRPIRSADLYAIVDGCPPTPGTESRTGAGADRTCTPIEAYAEYDESNTILH